MLETTKTPMSSHFVLQYMYIFVHFLPQPDIYLCTAIYVNRNIVFWELHTKEMYEENISVTYILVSASTSCRTTYTLFPSVHRINRYMCGTFNSMKNRYFPMMNYSMEQGDGAAGKNDKAKGKE